MARPRTPRLAQTDYGQGYDNRRDPRTTPERRPRASRDQLNQEAHRELEHDDFLMEVLSQFQANWKLREEHRQSIGPPPTRLYDSDHASTSNLRQGRSRFSYPTSSRPYQDTDFVYTFDVGSRVGSLPRDRQSHQHLPSPSQNHRAQQRRSSQKAYGDNRVPSRRPPTLSSAHVLERFAQGGSDLSVTPVQPRDYGNAPTVRQSPTGSPPDHTTEKLRGLIRRPRVQSSRHRVHRVRGGGLGSVDLETSHSQATEMDYSVMSVRPNLEGSGSNLSSRFVRPPTIARKTTIGRPGGRARRPGVSPSQDVNSEAEQPRSRIKAPEGAGSVSNNTHSIPKKEPHTVVIPSLMNDMEWEWPSSSPVSTPKAPPLDQQYVIRGDLQQEDERLIAGRRTDLRISLREAAAVEDRRSFQCLRSTTPPIGVSHLQTRPAPVNENDGKKEPRQQALFQELYQMLGPQDPDILRSGVEAHRDGKLGEGITRQDCVNEEGSVLDTPRGPGVSEQTVHVDILLAQRVVRDAMWEDEECLGQSCMLSASECGEEAVDSSSDWVECGLDRKHSTRSVFDWEYA